MNDHPRGSSVHESLEVWALSSPPPAAMSDAIIAVEEAPQDETRWDELESLVEETQRPDVVVALYGKTLTITQDPALAERLGSRAVRFHDEWSGESEPLEKLLSLVLRLNAGASWAFERMTMVLTMGERWSELLSLYDLALQATSDLLRRREILDEAAHIAKDFAGQPERAMDYLWQLLQLRPTDGALAASLERLLESRNKALELVHLWELRASVLEGEAAQTLRLKAALCWEERVGNFVEAVRSLEALLHERYEEATVVDTLKKISSNESAIVDSRSKAYGLLEVYFRQNSRESDELQALSGALTVVTSSAERARLHHRAAALLERQGDAQLALEHLAQYVPLVPTDEDALETLRDLGEQIQAYDLVASALSNAANALGIQPTALALREEAADLLITRTQDKEKAARLLLHVFWASEATIVQARRVGERLWREHLLTPGPQNELLPVLERLAELGPGEEELAPASWRHSLLGEIARVAHAQKLPEHALRAWELRWQEDPKDQEAINGRIRALEELERWEPLIQALQARADQTEEEDLRRRDLIHIAKVVAATVRDQERAIEAWRGIEANFGREDDTIDALAELYDQAGRTEELETLLREAEATAQPGERRAEFKARLGDLSVEKGQKERALTLFSEALSDNANNSRARQGLRPLLEHPALGIKALEQLVEACERTGDWRERLDLLEYRLKATEDEIARGEILVEAASDLEHQSADLISAQKVLGRALELNPNAIAIERDILRLAEQTDQWQEAASALAHGLAAAAALVTLGGPPRRALELRLRLGNVLEERLDNQLKALEAYRHVVQEDPRFPGALTALLRVSAHLQQPVIVAETLLQAASTFEILSPDLVEVVETYTPQRTDWEATTEALEKIAEQAPEPVRHTLFLQLGRWHRDQLAQPDSAEVLLERAATLLPNHIKTLEELADLQRQTPGTALIRTLQRLSQARGGDETVLREAIELALHPLEDEELSITLLEELNHVAKLHWQGSEPRQDTEPFREHFVWAQQKLVTLHKKREGFSAAIHALLQGTKLPFDRMEILDMLHRAAQIARRNVGDLSQAAALLHDALALDPMDPIALETLAEIYGETGAHRERIELRRHELAQNPPLERRLELRLDLAATAEVLEDHELRIQVLRENLREHAGHPASIQELSTTLSKTTRYRELFDLYSSQAEQLEATSDRATARTLWLHAAEVAEQQLGSLSEAITAQLRAAQIEATSEVLDALGRLYMTRGEPDAAIPWLERRLQQCSEEEHPTLVQRLATALSAAGRTEDARHHLEKIYQQYPRDRAIRSQLITLYRGTQAWQALVTLALSSAEQEEDTQLQLGLFLEAADVLQRRLHDPVRAVDLLRKSSDLAPQDRNLRVGLADALRAAGQLEEARQLLEGLLSEFGRRRPPERAAVHYQLALLAQTQGDTQEALSQLDTATSMDMGHGGILLLLGRLAREAGQLDRAERAFRALLLLLRRQRPDVPSSHQVELCVAELTFELYQIAEQLGQTERAAELLESTFETAAQNAQEATKLERSLQKSGQIALLLRALTTRMERASTREERSAALHSLALTHEQLQQFPEAFSSLEQAIRLTPEQPSLHETAKNFAKTPSFREIYTHLLHELASAALGEHAASLWLRLAAFHESCGELTQAALACELACETGFYLLQAHRSLLRIRGAQGDVTQKLRSQRAIVDLLSDGDSVPLAEALYELAEQELSSAETQDSGASTLERAMDLSSRPEETLALLRKYAPSSLSRPLLALQERLARRIGDRKALLEALERLCQLEGSEDNLFREAADLADQLGETSRSEALLLRAVEITGGTWAMIALAHRAKASSRWEQAQSWFQRAANEIGGDEGHELGLEAAVLAAESLQNKSLATQCYLQLWKKYPGDRRVWEPLLSLARESGDSEQLDRILAETSTAVESPEDRRALRMERARILLEDPFRQEDAIAALQEMLQEDPSDRDAQALLLDIYEQTGRSSDLASLLQNQLEEACTRRALDEISTLALRLGTLLSKSNKDEAIAVYRIALEASPDDAMLLRELLGLIGPQGNPAERASLLSRLLKDEAITDGAKLAFQLADAYATIGDTEGEESALQRGLHLAPEDRTLRSRIEKFYTTHQRWRPLIELLTHEAEHQRNPRDAATRLHQAAKLLGKQLGDPHAAITLLRKAHELVPEDLDLLRTLVDTLLDAGDQEAARNEVEAALAHAGEGSASRAQLLRLDALLALRQGRELDAVTALEQAVHLGAKEANADLLEALEQCRQNAAHRGDREAERSTTLRLAELHLQAGSNEEGLGLLRKWIERQPEDLEALRRLLDLEVAAKNWPAVVELCNRLITSDPEESKTEAALRLLEACMEMGNPAEARTGLEIAFSSFPKNVPVRSALRQLYEQLNAQRELADILLHEAADMENEADRFIPYRRAAELYIASGYAPNALPVLEAALHAKPGDHDCTVLLADSYITMQQLEMATNLLDASIAGHKNKRSPQLSILQHRMARVALAAGDRSIEVQWLNAALDSDAHSGQVAAELADSATEIGQYDLALKALRAITVSKNPGPMSKGMAYYRQGLISYHQGDQRKAVVMAKRGLQEDPNLTEARTFLEQLGEKVLNLR